jgi:hypothetical protein
MRTPAVHFGGLNSWTFWKNGAQFYFLKNREISCHHPFKKRLRRAANYIRLFQRKSLGSAPIQLPIRGEKRGWSQAEACRPLTWANPWFLPLRRYGESSVRAFHNTVWRNRWRNNNCAVACTRTVEVLKRLIGTLRRCGGGGEPRG